MENTPFNIKGERHGVWNIYWTNNQLHWSCQYINGEEIGLCPEYHNDGSLVQLIFFIK